MPGCATAAIDDVGCNRFRGSAAAAWALPPATDDMLRLLASAAAAAATAALQPATWLLSSVATVLMLVMLWLRAMSRSARASPSVLLGAATEGGADGMLDDGWDAGIPLASTSPVASASGTRPSAFLEGRYLITSRRGPVTADTSLSCSDCGLLTAPQTQQHWRTRGWGREAGLQATPAAQPWPSPNDRLYG